VRKSVGEPGSVLKFPFLQNVFDVALFEIRRNMRIVIDLPQRQPDKPDASKSQPGYLPNAQAGLVCRPFEIEKLPL